MFKIGPFHVLKQPFSQESMAVASCFVISRMHWSHFWKQIWLHLFLSGQRRLIISQDLSRESVCHNFSGSVSSQRGTDLKNLLSQVFIAGKVVNTSVKSGTTLKKKRWKNILNTFHHVIPRPQAARLASILYVCLHKHTGSTSSKVIVLTLCLLICRPFLFRKLSFSLFNFSMS